MTLDNIFLSCAAQIKNMQHHRAFVNIRKLRKHQYNGQCATTDHYNQYNKRKLTNMKQNLKKKVLLFISPNLNTMVYFWNKSNKDKLPFKGSNCIFIAMGT